MKKSYKIILAIIGILILAFVVIIIPLPESSPWQIDDSVLLEYHNLGFGTSNEIIKIFKDGSVEFTNGRDIFTTKLSDEDLQTLTRYIESKEYLILRKSLFAKWTEPSISDRIYFYYLINEDGKTFMIATDKLLSDINQKIYKQARPEL